MATFRGALDRGFNDGGFSSATFAAANQQKALFERSPRDKDLVALLTSQHFSDGQIDKVLSHLSVERFRSANDLKTIEAAIVFWKSCLKPPRLKPDQFFPEEITPDTRYKFVNVNHILSSVDPDLLLICPDAMKLRIDKFRSIGFMAGINDVWQVFATAPRGYFLQDWTEFQRKYMYLQFRVMEWIIDSKKEKYPTPHPLVEHAQVFEMSYEHIKARFQFAVKTGFKSVTTSTKVENTPKMLSLGRLMLTDLEDYLALVAPYCTEEEYLVFEQMVADAEDEDDEIIDDLTELTALGTKGGGTFSSSRPKEHKDRERLLPTTKGDQKDTIRLVRLDG